MAPFARRYLNKFAEENLVVFRNNKVFLVMVKVLASLFVVVKLLHVFANGFGD